LRREHGLCIRSTIYSIHTLGMYEMNKLNFLLLESHIHNLWSVKEQVKTLMWRYMDHPVPMTEDEMANHLMSVEYALDLYIEKLFDEYKKICQIDEYAPPEVIAERTKMLNKLLKKKIKEDTDGRC
jgi:hypothetical protein